jgi:hypothetical protein
MIVDLHMECGQEGVQVVRHNRSWTPSSHVLTDRHALFKEAIIFSELRHRRRARAEDRIHAAKDTGLTNLPLHELDQNRIWCAIVALACALTTRAQLLGLTQHPIRRWEPRRLRLRLFTLAGRLARTARRTVLHLPRRAPGAGLLLQAITTPARAAPARLPLSPG